MFPPPQSWAVSPLCCLWGPWGTSSSPPALPKPSPGAVGQDSLKLGLERSRILPPPCSVYPGSCSAPSGAASTPSPSHPWANLETLCSHKLNVFPIFFPLNSLQCCSHIPVRVPKGAPTAGSGGSGSCSPFSPGEGLCQDRDLRAAGGGRFAFQGWFLSQGPLNLGETPKFLSWGLPNRGHPVGLGVAWARAPGFLLDKGVSSGQAAPAQGEFGLLGTDLYSRAL